MKREYGSVRCANVSLKTSIGFCLTLLMKYVAVALLIALALLILLLTAWMTKNYSTEKFGAYFYPRAEDVLCGCPPLGFGVGCPKTSYLSGCIAGGCPSFQNITTLGASCQKRDCSCFSDPNRVDTCVRMRNACIDGCSPMDPNYLECSNACWARAEKCKADACALFPN